MTFLLTPFPEQKCDCTKPADHAIIVRILREDYVDKITACPIYTTEVRELWFVCVDCGSNYQGGYPCELVHLDGSGCYEPFQTCSQVAHV